MSFWTLNTITDDNMARLGPLVQGVVGTDGEYQDLYDAMCDPGGPQWDRVFVTPGATLSNGDILKTAKIYCAIIGIGVIAFTGTKKITFTNCDVALIENIRINNTVTGGTDGAISFKGTSSRSVIRNVWVVNSSDGRGIGFFDTANRNRVEGCQITGANSDGIYIAATATLSNWIAHCNITGNGGWGIQDNPDIGFIHDNIVTGNASGQIDSSSSYKHDNKIA